MCWVMPPASPATTLAWRMASSSEVLPWSTWPMIVTIGGRGTDAPSSSGRSNRPSSTSESATRLTVWPISSAISSAVSASSTSVSVTMRPWRIRSLMTSTARSDMRAASSWMVIASGSTISRAIFSLWSCIPPPLRRWVRRRNEATERVRSSSAEVAVVTVRRPRFRCSAPRVGRGVGIITFCGRIGPRAGRLTTRAASSAPALGAAGGAAGGGAAASRRLLGQRLGLGLRRPARRRGRRGGLAAGEATARLLFDLTLETGFLGATKPPLRACAYRPRRVRRVRGSRARGAPRPRPPGGGGPPPRGPSRRATPWRAPPAARRCSVGSTTPVLGGGALGRAGAPLPGASDTVGFGGDAALGAAGGGVSPGPRTRRLTFSTTTALLRPCEKLWRTVPCSTGRFRCRVAFGGAAPDGLSLLLVSFMPIPNRLAFQPIRPLGQAPPHSRPARRRRRCSDPRPPRSRENGAAARPAPGRPRSPRRI